jgi:hypothetical protein
MKKQSLSPLILAACALVSIPAAAQHPAGLLAVHGIDGRDLGFDQSLPVDVAIDGACALTDFQYGQTVGPVPLPRGTYSIAISLSDGNCGGAVVIEADVKFGAGKFKSVVAHLDLEGAPTASVFKINNNELRDGFGRVYMAHTANAPKVDITAKPRGSEGVVFTAKNGEARTADVGSGRYTSRIYPALAPTQVAGPVRFRVRSNEILAIYAVGTFPDTFNILSQRIPTGPLPE